MILSDSSAPDLQASNLGTIDAALAVNSHAEDVSSRLHHWLTTDLQSQSGAFFAWVDHGSGKPSYEYPEITGYALTYLARSVEKSRIDGPEIRAGHSAATWLASLIEDRQLAARVNWDGHAIYNFDLAMIANGLLNFGTATADDRWVDSGLVLVQMLVRQVERYGYLPSIDPDGPVQSTRSAWSTEGFAHLVKTAQCLMTASALGEPGAEEAAGRIIEHGVWRQETDGRISTHRSDFDCMLHPLFYAVEGLWTYGCATNSEVALGQARAAASWAWQFRMESGGFPRYISMIDGSYGAEQCDATAQALRAAVLTELDVDVVPTVDRLCAIVLPIGDESCAMPYQPHSHPLHRNAWASMFAVQALELSSLPSSHLFDWRHLV